MQMVSVGMPKELRSEFSVVVDVHGSAPPQHGCRTVSRVWNLKRAGVCGSFHFKGLDDAAFFC